MHIRTQIKAGYTLQDAANTTCKAAHQTSGYLSKAQQEARTFVRGIALTTLAAGDTLVRTFSPN
jgi:hypothetical protein